MSEKFPTHTHALPAAAVAQQAPWVLVIDDEEAVRFVYRRMIAASGYRVDTCGTLDEAVEFLGSRRYIAVVTDLRLAGSDGSEGLAVVSCSRAYQPQAKVIVMTGYGSEEDSLARGASFFLKKPLEPSLILELLGRIREQAGGEAAREPDA